MLYPNICKPSDYVPLNIEVSIIETNIDISTRSISKNSEAEKDFITVLTNGFFNLNSSAIRSKDSLENLTQQVTLVSKSTWNNYSKLKHITKYSKE